MIPYYYSADGKIQIYHGDCRAILPALCLADHIITDPPYDKETHSGARTAADHGSEAIPIDFDPLDTIVIVPNLLKHANRWVIAFCSLEMLGDYRRAANDAWIRAGFWRRPDAAPQFTGDRPGQPGEGIAIMHRPLSAGRKGRTQWHGGGKHGYYEFGVVRDGRQHPTQKPESLMLAIIEDFTNPGELIIDPFMGSGTTLVAAKQLGRRAIGIELEKKYCDVAAARLSQNYFDFEHIYHHDSNR